MDRNAHRLARIRSDDKKLMTGLALSLVLLNCLIITMLGTLTRQPGCPYLRIWFRDKCEYSRLPVDLLLIDQSYFPTAVEIERNGPQKHHYGVAELASVTVRDSERRVLGGQEIWRWARSSRAHEEYNTLVSDEFRFHFPCCTDSNFHFESFFADQSTARCSTANVCIGVLQYEDYVTVVRLEVSPEFNWMAFQSLLKKVDERFAAHLDASY